jgi:hypothetical protein
MLPCHCPAALIENDTHPMSKKLKKLSDGNVWTRWNKRITRVRHELHYVYSTRRKFSDVTSLFENNEKLKSIGGEVYDWVFRMWARDIVIAIRRELDNDTNTVCLGRLLDEMAQRPKVITRARYLGDIPEDDFKYRTLWQTFDGFGIVRQSDTARMTDYLDPAGIAADSQRLAKVAKSVLGYANQLVAHRSETEHVPVTLGDVNRTVDAIEETFIKYYAIIGGPSLVGLEPSLSGNWMAPFEIPWLVREEQ